MSKAKKKFQFTKSQLFLIFIISSMAGVFFAIYFTIQILPILIITLSLIALFIIFRKESQVLAVVLFAFGIILGIFYYHFKIDRENQISAFYSQNVQIKDQIDQEPAVKSDKIQYVLKIAKINGRAAGNLIYVMGDRYPQYQFGDWAKITGTLQNVSTSSEFDYQEYSRVRGIFGIVWQAQIEIISPPTNINFWHRVITKVVAQLYNIKTKFITSLNQVLPEPESSLMAGILIGARASIPQDLLLNFNQTGLTHIIAISGFNITIIVSFFCALFRFAPKKISVPLILLGIIAFVILTGATSSVIRAAIFAGLILFAKLIGRKSVGINLIFFVAFLMVLSNPYILRYDIGFQLSFLATLGLMFLQPVLEKKIIKGKIKKFIPKVFTEAFCATASAQVFVLPILLYNFHQFSIIAPIANILVLPLVPTVMFLGFLLGLIGMININLANLFSFYCWFLLKYIIKMTQILAKIPAAFFQVNKFSAIWVAIYYLLLIFLIKNLQKRIVKNE
jgi:competence protein ComEC